MRPLGSFAVLLLSLAAGCLDPDGFQKNKDFLVIGHRGAPHEAAENTLPAFDAAVQLGANALELDLCVTQDGAIVVWHDRDPDDTVALARQNGIEGLLYRPWVPGESSPLRRPVEELPLADFLANYGYSRDGSTRDPQAVIPLLGDFVAWLELNSGDIRAVYLDVKMGAGQTALAEFVMTEVETARVAHGGLVGVTIYFISPHRDVVEALIARRSQLGASDFRTAWDFETSGALAGTEMLGLRDISTGLTPLRSETEFLAEVEDLVAAREDKRVDSVVVWTIDRRMELGQLIFRNVDGIMTNRPELLYELWQITLK